MKDLFMITIPLYRYNGTKIRFLTLSAIKRAINTATKLVTKAVQYLLVYYTNLRRFALNYKVCVFAINMMHW